MAGALEWKNMFEGKRRKQSKGHENSLALSEALKGESREADEHFLQARGLSNAFLELYKVWRPVTLYLFQMKSLCIYLHICDYRCTF